GGGGAGGAVRGGGGGAPPAGGGGGALPPPPGGGPPAGGAGRPTATLDRDLLVHSSGAVALLSRRSSSAGRGRAPRRPSDRRRGDRDGLPRRGLHGRSRSVRLPGDQRCTLTRSSIARGRASGPASPTPTR